MNVRPVFPIPAFVCGVAIAAVNCGNGPSQTPESPTVAQPSPPVLTLTGRVLAAGGYGVREATVTALDGLNNGRSTTTDISGAYRFDNLHGTSTNFLARAAGCSDEQKAAVVDGRSTLDFGLQCDTVPRLLSPSDGATLDNTCAGGAWAFDWSDVPNIAVSEYRRATGAGPGISDGDAHGWLWRVRARISDTWNEWSATRRFDVGLLSTACPPVITSISPSSPMAGANPQTILLRGEHLAVPGAVTATSPSGRVETSPARQPGVNNPGVATSLTLAEAGAWTLYLDTGQNRRSNTFAFTVR